MPVRVDVRVEAKFLLIGSLVDEDGDVSRRKGLVTPGTMGSLVEADDEDYEVIWDRVLVGNGDRGLTAIGECRACHESSATEEIAYVGFMELCEDDDVLHPIGCGALNLDDLDAEIRRRAMEEDRRGDRGRAGDVAADFIRKIGDANVEFFDRVEEILDDFVSKI